MNRNASLTCSMLSLILYATADYGYTNYSNLHPQIAILLARLIQFFQTGKEEVEIGMSSGGFHLGQDEAIGIFLIAAFIYGMIALLFAWSMERIDGGDGLRKKLVFLSIVAMLAPIHMFLVINHVIDV